MASIEVEPTMADIAPASLADARILDEVMNDGDEEAMRQLEIDIHEEVCMMFLHSCFVVAKFLHKVAKMPPAGPRAYLQPKSRFPIGSRNATLNRGRSHRRNTDTANNTEPSIYPDHYKGPVSFNTSSTYLLRHS